jgi:Cu(I)/Ag(I) efflux system membrane fusion protein
MNKWAQSVLAVVLAAGFFLAGVWYNQRATVKGAVHEGRRILYWQDPMHPAYKSDKPGIAPDCGMRLVPVYVDGESGSGDGRASSSSESGSERGSAPSSTGSVHITPRQQRSIGLETETVTPTAGSVQTLRVLGRVALDEARIYPLVAATDGWIRQAGPIVTGEIVSKDEILATFYNREFLTAQQSYLYALGTMDRNKKSGEGEEQMNLTGAQERGAEENLESLGMSEAQLREVARTRKIAKDIEFRSPVAGLVVDRKAFSGLRFTRGEELFRIADVHHVWIVADVFENDARLVRAARSATVRYQDRELPARISNVLPLFDPASRALKVRLETDNPGYMLRPDMFVDVELQVTLPQGIAVPADAVIDSGLRKTVYVQTADGGFTPRPVETGWRMGDSVQITKGLQPGERIVVAGNFLLDSESRMKLSGSR